VSRPAERLDRVQLVAVAFLTGWVSPAAGGWQDLRPDAETDRR